MAFFKGYWNIFVNPTSNGFKFNEGRSNSEMALISRGSGFLRTSLPLISQKNFACKYVFCTFTASAFAFTCPYPSCLLLNDFNSLVLQTCFALCIYVPIAMFGPSLFRKLNALPSFLYHTGRMLAIFMGRKWLYLVFRLARRLETQTLPHHSGSAWICGQKIRPLAWGLWNLRTWWELSRWLPQTGAI